MERIGELVKEYITNDWKTKNMILGHLLGCGVYVNERSLRQYIARFNKEYENGESEWFIAHGQKGYMMTDNNDLILNSLKDDHKRALKLLKRYGRCRKALSEKNQLSLDQEEASLYDIVMMLDGREKNDIKKNN